MVTVFVWPSQKKNHMVMITYETVTNTFSYASYCDVRSRFHKTVTIGFGHGYIRFGDGWGPSPKILFLVVCTKVYDVLTWFSQSCLPLWMRENILLFNKEYHKEHKQIQLLSLKTSHSLYLHHEPWASVSYLSLFLTFTS